MVRGNGIWRFALTFAFVSVVFPSARAVDERNHEADQLNAQVVQLFNQGKYNEAIPVAQRALSTNERVFGPEHPDTATALNNLALMYQATGAYTEAEPLLQRALAIREKALGPLHTDTALSLSNLAELYRAMGAYAKAEPLLQRALAIREKVLGPAHLDTAIVLNNLALLYQATGNYAKAEPLFLRALTIYEKGRGSEHPDTAVVLNNLAGLYKATGRYAMAEPLFQRALAINEKARGPDHPGTAASLISLASLYRSTGAYEKAEPLVRRALDIDEKALGADHPSTAAALTDLAGLYLATGAYAKAEPLFLRALAIREKVLGPEHPDTAISLGGLAEFYRTTGAYAKAEALMQRVLEIHEKTLGPENPDTAFSLSNLGELYRTTGAYAKAEPLYLRALALREKVLGPEHPDTAAVLNNLALLYLATGSYAKAEPLFRRALAINEKALGAEHPDTATVVNNDALAYQAMGEYAKAEPLFRRALAIREKSLGPNHPDTAVALSNLGELYRAMGVYAQAQPLYERALEITEKSLGSEHANTAVVLNNLANLYEDTGAYTKAAPLLERALAINQKALGQEHPNTSSILHNLGVLYEATGAYSKAQILYAQGLVIDESNTTRFLFTGSEERKRAFLQRRADNTYGNVSFSVANPTVLSTVLGLTSVLQYKGRVLDAMSDSASRLRLSVATEDRALFDQLSAVAEETSTLTFGGAGSLPAEAYRRRLNDLAQRQEQLEGDLSSRSAALRLAVTPVTIANVQRTLPVDTVLVEWIRYLPFNPKASRANRWGTPRYAAFLLKHAGDPTEVDIGPAQPIEQLIAEFRTALSDPTSTYVNVVAGELFKKLVKPLRPVLMQEHRLLLSPDGPLNLVPFAALVDESGDFLVQHFELTYLTSGRDLLRVAVESPAKGAPVILANPNFGKYLSGALPGAESTATRSTDLDRSGLQFAPLAGTAAEAKALQSLLKLDAQNVLTGDRATEASLRDLHGPRILHVATHGFFLNDQEVALMGHGSETGALPFNENPLLRSGLALAGANARHSGTLDDGILTAAEAAQLDLRGTQLVVLSACDTGVGEVRIGEGVYGLRRALVLAGVQAQVGTLWKVADEATKDLMFDFYGRLINGEGRSAALRESQQDMLANPVRKHPYYWAAFVPIGDWTALR